MIALSLLYGSLVRTNGIIVALPLILVWAGQLTSSRPTRRLRLWIATLAIVTIVAAGASLKLLPNVTTVDIWPTAVIWDLAAMSLEVDKMLVPAEFQGNPVSLKDLRQHFKPSTNVTMSQVSFWYGIHAPYAEGGYQRLISAYLRAIGSHPTAYLTHRTRLFRLLMGTDMQKQVHFQPGIARYKDNPPINPPEGKIHDVVVSSAHWLTGRWVTSGWFHLIIVICLGVVGIRNRNEILTALSASGLLLATSLFIGASATDVRYLLWLYIVSIVGSLHVWLALVRIRRSQPIDERR